MNEDTTSGNRGRIGNEIFEQVEKLVSEEGLSRSQAFQRVSDETGRRPGTVSANYYRAWSGWCEIFYRFGQTGETRDIFFRQNHLYHPRQHCHHFGNQPAFREESIPGGNE